MTDRQCSEEGCGRPHHARGYCEMHYHRWRYTNHGRVADDGGDARNTRTLPDLTALGITYRQLDYWTRAGWIHTDGNDLPGTGRRRRWPPEELEVASRLSRLSRVGIDPSAALPIARGETNTLGSGVIITFDPDWSEGT